MSLKVDLLRLDLAALRLLSPQSIPLRIILWGRAEGALRLRLTFQADDTHFLRLAHVAVTDASMLRVRLENYDLEGSWRGRALRFVAGQLPLRRVEGAANDALQQYFTDYPGGWDVSGGVTPQPPSSASLPPKQLPQAIPLAPRPANNRTPAIFRPDTRQQ